MDLSRPRESGTHTVSCCYCISKNEYLKCGFNGEEVDKKEVTMSATVISKAKKFRCLGLIIEEKGDIDEDINQRIRVG